MNRDDKLSILLDSEQKTELCRLAQRAGVSLSDVVRSFLPNVSQLYRLNQNPNPTVSIGA